MTAGFLIALSLPGLVFLLVTAAALEGFGQWLRGRSWLPWRRGAAGTPVAGTGIQELEAFFSATKRAEVETRAAITLMRDDEQGSAAPPRVQLDLDKGTATINEP